MGCNVIGGVAEGHVYCFIVGCHGAKKKIMEECVKVMHAWKAPKVEMAPKRSPQNRSIDSVFQTLLTDLQITYKTDRQT